MDIPPTQERIEAVVQDDGEEDNGEGVEVANNVVGDAIGGKHICSGVGGLSQAIVINVLEGKEGEDPGGLEGAAHIIDKGVVPRDVDWVAALDNNGGSGRVEEALPPLEEPPHAAASEADAKNPEDIA